MPCMGPRATTGCSSFHKISIDFIYHIEKGNHSVIVCMPYTDMRPEQEIAQETRTNGHMV